MAPADRQARPWHAVWCPLLSDPGCEERDNWRTDSRGQVGRAGIRHDRGIRSAENGGQFRERQLASKVTSLTTRNEARQRGLIRRSGDDHSISGSQQRSHDGLAVSCRGTPGRNRRTGMHDDVRCRAYPSGDVGQRSAYCEPGTQFVGGKLRRWPVKAAFGLRRSPCHGAADPASPGSPRKLRRSRAPRPSAAAGRAARRLVIGGQHECSVEAPSLDGAEQVGDGVGTHGRRVEQHPGRVVLDDVVDPASSGLGEAGATSIVTWARAATARTAGPASSASPRLSSRATRTRRKPPPVRLIVS